MYRQIYIELNAVCILMLLYIFLRGRKNIDQRLENICFNRVVLVTALVMIFDIARSCFNMHPGTTAFVLNTVFSAAYLAAAGFVSFFWLRYVWLRLRRSTPVSVRVQALTLLPQIALTLLCASAPWNRLLFFIDASNLYHRGRLYYILLMILCGYMFVAFVSVLLCYKQTASRRERDGLHTLLVFVLFPSLGGLVTALFPALPCLWPATTMSLLLVYTNIQDLQISTDSLTTLNNRREFDNYLHNMLHDERRSDAAWLLLFDVDFFKRINDEFGHLEGDRALQTVAQTLKKACCGSNAFLARYGGDEFAIVVSGPEAAVNSICDAVDENFLRLNHGDDRKYALSLSVGSSAFSPGSGEKPDAVIARADAKLYAEKERHRLSYL